MELRDYLNVIRARKWTIVQAVVIVTLTAVVISLLMPKVYEGQAKVLISEKDTGAALFGTTLSEFSSQPERGLQTQVQLMQVRPLAENTIRQLGLQTSPEALLRRISVSGVGQTNVVVITATASTPDSAADIANTMASEYVDWSRETRRESVKAAADEVEARLQSAEEEILALGQRIEEQGRTDELDTELQILTGTYTTLTEKLEELRINEQLETGSGIVVSPAIVNDAPVAPSPRRNALLGLGIGLVFGVGMAFLYEYLDDTIKSTEEAEKVYGAPVLGIMPLEKYEKGRKRQVTVLDLPGSPAAEAYRVLRSSLDFVNFERDIKTLLVTSAAPGEGKSTVSANLAASLAQTGKKIVLLSCDFRRSTTTQFFNVSGAIGLSDVLLGTHTLKSALQRPIEEQLLVLTAGKMPPNPSELLGSSKMESLLAELGEWADWIIIDSPPVLAVADPVAVSRWSDGVLIVSKAGESSKDAAAKGIELLGKVGARIIGVAVWGLDDTKNRPGYGYGYGYGHYTGGYYYSRSYYGYSVGPATSGDSPADGDAAGDWSVKPGAVRRVATAIGRILSGLLALLAVLAVAFILAYLLDQYFDWNIVPDLTVMVPWL